MARLLGCLSFDVSASLDKAVRVLPLGEFAPNDGRPLKSGRWFVTAERAQQIAAYWRSKPEKFCIDYHHSTQTVAKVGGKAPAAGWAEGISFDVRADGIYVRVDWTDTARAEIADKHFLYLSPVFAYDEDTGEVFALLMAALTNIPGLTGLTELNPAMLSQFFNQEVVNEEEGTMDKQLLKTLGLAEDAKPEVVTAAVAKLQADLKAENEKVAALSAEVDTHKDTVATLQAQVSAGGAVDAGSADDKKVIAQLQAQVSTLQSENNERAVNELVEAALEDGRLSATTEKWARDLGKKDVAQLQAFLNVQPKIAVLNGTQTGGVVPAGVTVEGVILTAEDIATCEAMGISQADFAKTKAAMSE